MQGAEVEVTSFVLMNGLLNDNPLGELIREIQIANLSGALRLARERVKAVVYFEAGAVVFVSSNLRMHRLAELLKRWDVIPPERLDALLIEAMTDAEAGAALTAAGLIDREGLEKVRKRQSAETLRPMLLWTDGEWSFDLRSRLNQEMQLQLDLNQLLIDASRRLSTNFIAARLANQQERIAPATDTVDIAALQLLPAEGFVLSRADAPMALSELIAMCSGLPETEALQAIYALLVGGFLVKEDWPKLFSPEAIEQEKRRIATLAATERATTEAAAKKPTIEEKRDEAKTDEKEAASVEAEINALFSLASGADHYEVLGIARNAQASDVKRAYYALAKRFHPDRFHRDADSDLRTRIEQAFAKIAQAYEVLKDGSSRQAYDMKLASQINQPVHASGNNAPSSAREETAKSSAQSATDGPISDQRRAEESFQRGLSAMQRGDQNQALANFAEAAQLMPEQPRYRAYYGRALINNPQTRRQAEAEIQAAIKLDAKNATYHVILAELYRAVGLHRKAISEIEQALFIDPRNTEARRLFETLKR